MARRPRASGKKKREQTRPLFPELAEKERQREAARRIETMRNRLRTQLKFPGREVPVKERARIMAMRINSRTGRMLLSELQGPLNLERHKIEGIAIEATRIRRAFEKKRLTEAQAREFLAQVEEFRRFV